LRRGGVLFLRARGGAGSGLGRGRRRRGGLRRRGRRRRHALRRRLRRRLGGGLRRGRFGTPAERAEIEIGPAVHRLGRLPGRFRCRFRGGRGALRRGRFRRRGGGARRGFTDEAVLVELDDQLLEPGVPALADLAGDVAERGAAVDRGEHRAVAAAEKTGLAGSLLNTLAGLRVDGGGIHSLTLIIFICRRVLGFGLSGGAVAAPARRLDNEDIPSRHLGPV